MTSYCFYREAKHGKLIYVHIWREIKLCLRHRGHGQREDRKRGLVASSCCFLCHHDYDEAGKVCLLFENTHEYDRTSALATKNAEALTAGGLGLIRHPCKTPCL